MIFGTDYVTEIASARQLCLASQHRLYGLALWKNGLFRVGRKFGIECYYGSF